MRSADYGIISYAGIAKDALLTGTRALFAYSGMPRRYRSLLPVFPVEMIQNMDYIGKPTKDHKCVALNGFSMDPAEYHYKMSLEHPALYIGDNFSRNFDYEGNYLGGSVFTVDSAWAELFPQYRPFLGEKLVIHMIGKGCQAVAVPESIKMRSGFLDAAEEQLDITVRAQTYIRYAIENIRAGKAYQADTFAEEYLESRKVDTVSITQRELECLLQREAMLSGKHTADKREMFYLREARQAGQIPQYVPMRYACDLFSEETVKTAYARLAQPFYTDRNHISDFWIPYQDILLYVHQPTRTLDMRKLCESYQIAPAYDPNTFGGQYPDGIRIAVVRDRDIRIMVADALNNPAYGRGLNISGVMGKHVFIKNSPEMIRARRMDVERITFHCENLQMSAEEFLAQQQQARQQEMKGRLIDALYRLQMTQACRDTEQDLIDRLQERAERMQAAVRIGAGAMTGYDTDINYLLHKQRNPSFTDAMRETSIECGYAMRNAYCQPQDTAELDMIPEDLESAVQETREYPINDEPELSEWNESGMQLTEGEHPMKLLPQDIAKMLDHSTLQPFLTQEDIQKGCELALHYNTASVCARPADMPLVKKMLAGSDVHVCTVIGFPHGNHKSEIKLAEAEAALNDGCEELDMVINIGRLIAGDDQYVQDEIANICALAHSRGAKVKVIIETCYLNDAQKVNVCQLAAAAGADWVKTSTGYGSAGCKLEDVILMRKSVPANCQVKGSGGIRDLDTVLALRTVGATRCGVSATEKIMAEAEERYQNGTLEEPTLDDLNFEEGESY